MANKREGDFILNNYDKDTGLPFNSKVISQFPDGALITDADVDNKVLLKNSSRNGEGYSVRSFDVGQSKILVVDNIESVRNLSKSNILMFRLGIYDTINTLGYYTVNDGGGFEYLYNPLSSDTDDGFLFIKPNLLVTGRFEPRIKGDINVKIAGIQETSVDNTAIYNRIFNAFSEGGEFLFPKGSFDVSGVVINQNNVTIRGFDNSTILNKTANDTSFKVLGNNFKISNLKFELGIYTAATSFAINSENTSGITIDSLELSFGGYGIQTTNCNNVKINKCIIHDFNYWGIFIVGGNNIEITRNTCYNAITYDGIKLAGYDIDRLPIDLTNVKITDNIAYNNARDGLDLAINNLSNCLITNNNFYDNVLQGIDLKCVYQGTLLEDIIISNNILINNNEAGMNLQNALPEVVYKNLRVYDNTVKSPTGYGIRIVGAEDSSVYNNKIDTYLYCIRVISCRKLRVFSNEGSSLTYGIEVTSQDGVSKSEFNEIYNNKLNTLSTCVILGALAENNRVIDNEFNIVENFYRVTNNGVNNLILNNVTGYEGVIPVKRGMIGELVINTNPDLPFMGWKALTTSTTALWAPYGFTGEFSGSGDPNSSVNAKVGSRYTQYIGTNAILWVKIKNGTSMTGWVKVSEPSSAVANVTSADAIDLATALTLINELKTKLNAKLAADRASGQQAT